MAKGKKSYVPDQGKEVEFTNSAGKSFKILGLAPFVIPELGADLEDPETPTYTVTTVSGDVEVFKHDESTLKTPEDILSWKTYQAKIKENESILVNRLITYALIEGVELPSDADVSKWEKQQKLIGIPVPDDEEEKLLKFKRSIVLRSGEDIQRFISAVLDATGVGREAVEKAKKSFPDSMESSSSPESGNGSV